MKIPDCVRLDGVDYPIYFVDDLNDGENLLYGRIDYREPAIYINNNIGGHQNKCLSLLHEIGHAICRRISDDNIPDEEKIVETFARGYYQLLQDNGRKLFDLKKPEEAVDE